MQSSLTETQILELDSLIRDVLNLTPDFDVANLSAANCPAWDSLRHVELVLKVQDRFRIKFSGGEMVALRSVSDVKKLINSHLQARI